MQELNSYVAWFDSDDFTIEQALDTYKKAQTLATEIETELQALKNDITVLKKKFDA